MALNARDLFFILKVEDEGTRALQSFSRELLRVGDAAAAAQARSQAAALRAHAQQMKNIGATEEEVNAVLQQAAAYDTQARTLERSVSQHQKAASALRSVGQELILVGAGMMVAGGAIAAALLSTVKYAQEYQRQVALTKTQVDGFSASLQQLSNMGKQVANNIAVPFEQIQPALYDIFSSTNANLKQADMLLKAFAKTAVAGQVNISQASKGTMAILNGFHLPLEDVNNILDIQFQLVRKGVGTYGQFNSVLGRIIPSANRAGQNFQETAAMLAFMTRNGLSAAMAATSGARALDAFSNPLTAKNLAKIGVKVSDVHGNFLPLDQILGQMYQKMKGLSQVKRSELLKQIFSFGTGGNIQAMRFLTQVLSPGQYEEFIGFLGDMNHATGQFGMAYKTMADTTASKTELLKNRFKVLRETIGEILTPTFNKLVDGLSRIVQGFNNLSPHMQKMITYGLLFASAMLFVGGGVAVAIGAIGVFAGAIAALGLSFSGVALIVAGAVLAIVGFGVACYEAVRHGGALKPFLQDIRQWFDLAWQNAKSFATGLKKAFDEDIQPSLQKVKDFIKTEVLPALQDFWDNIWRKHKGDLAELKNWLLSVAKDGFKSIGNTIKNDLLPAFHELMDTYEKHKKGIQQLTSYLIDLAKWLAKLGGSGGFGALILIIKAAIIVLASVAVQISTVINWISKIIHWLGDLVSAFKKVSNAVGDFEAKMFNWAYKVGQAINTAKDKFISWVTGVKGYLGQAQGAIDAVPGKIKGVFAGAGSWLYSAGKALLQGLINGINAMKGALKSALGGITALIPSWKGPREKDLVLLRPAGQLVMRGFMRGIDDVVPHLKDQLNGITQNLMPNLNVTGNYNPAPFAAATAATAAKYTTVNVTVNTNEISPQYHAEQLGNYLAARI